MFLQQGGVLVLELFQERDEITRTGQQADKVCFLETAKAVGDKRRPVQPQTLQGKRAGRGERIERAVGGWHALLHQG